MQRFSAPILVSVLVLAACPADSGTTTSDTLRGRTTGTASTGPSSRPEPARRDADDRHDRRRASRRRRRRRRVSRRRRPATTGRRRRPDEGTTTTGVDDDGRDDPTDGTTTDGTTTDGTTGGDAVCGDGMKGGDEACDDSNLKTELSTDEEPPLMYDAKACIDDCSLVLSAVRQRQGRPGRGSATTATRTPTTAARPRARSTTRTITRRASACAIRTATRTWRRGPSRAATTWRCRRAPRRVLREHQVQPGAALLRRG
jgi:hypothetical protein